MRPVPKHAESTAATVKQFPAADVQVTQKTGRDLIVFGRFLRKSGPVLVKAGISFVSTANAEENLRHDIPGWNFNVVRSASRKLWNKATE